MQQSGGLLLDAVRAASTPLFSSHREENANESVRGAISIADFVLASLKTSLYNNSIKLLPSGGYVMSEFIAHLYSGRAYTSEEIISFSQSPMTHFADIDEEMQFHADANMCNSVV